MSIFQFFIELFGTKNRENVQKTEQEEIGSSEENKNRTYVGLATFADKEETTDGKFILYGLIINVDEEIVPIGFRFKLEVKENEFVQIELNKSYPVGIKEKRVTNIKWKFVN